MKCFGSCWTISVPMLDEPNQQKSLARKTKNIVKSQEDASDSSPFTTLPDEIILQVFNKVIDLKTLCICRVVSKRLSSIVRQVDAVSFTAPLLNSPDKKFFRDVDGDGLPKKFFRRVFKPVCLLRRKIGGPSKLLPPLLSFMSSFYCDSFRSAIKSIRKFKGVKSLSLEFPSSRHKRIDNTLFKWKVQFGTTIDSIFFLSPNSISETDEFHDNGNSEEEDMEVSDDQEEHFLQCLLDVIVRHSFILAIAKALPKLEEFSITESGRRGRLFISGEKLGQVKKDLAISKLYSTGIPSGFKHCYVPVMNLPVSGYVMKGVTLLVLEINGFQVGIGNDDLMNSDAGFEDKEEAAYNEALMEILEKHKGKMKVLA